MQPHEYPTQPEAIYREEQHFRQPWVWLVLGATALFVVLMLGADFLRQFLLSQQEGAAPFSGQSLLGVGAIALALVFGLFALFWTTRLETEVRGDLLRVRFAPLQPKGVEFSVKSLKSFEAVTYDPIREYGGWGIRFGRNGRAYNVSGNRGVQLVLEDGKRFLVGSGRAEELCTSLHRARNN